MLLSRSRPEKAKTIEVKSRVSGALKMAQDDLAGEAMAQNWFPEEEEEIEKGSNAQTGGPATFLSAAYLRYLWMARKVSSLLPLNRPSCG